MILTTDSIIEKLSSAESGSKELDSLIGRWADENSENSIPRRGPSSNYHVSKQCVWGGVQGYIYRNWTSSVDMAKTLLSPTISLDVSFDKGRYHVLATDLITELRYKSSHRSQAIAICIAAMQHKRNKIISQ